MTPTAQERAARFCEYDGVHSGYPCPFCDDLAAALEQVERETIERAYDSIAMMSCGCAHKIRALAGV